MGCWNGTCGISKMPIQHGDRVKLVLLKPTKHYRNISTGSGFCYSTDIMYRPISLPITGEYNDYGAIENIEDEPELFDLIKKTIKVPDRNNIEDIIIGISAGELENISYMLILESVYNVMLDIIKPMPHRYDNDYTIEMHKNDITKILIDYNSNYNKLIEDLSNGIRPPIPEIDVAYYQNDHYFRQLPENIRLPTGNNDLVPLKSNIVEFLIFTEAMEDARMFWSPQGGGSQNITYEFQIEIGKLAQQLRQDWNDEFLEEE